MQKRDRITMCLFVLAVGAVGFANSVLAGDIASLYKQFVLPPLAPPIWLFGVVWPVLYAMIGVAAALIYLQQGTLRSKALLVFAVQLAFNFAWSIVFFRFQLYWAAISVIVTLDVLVFYTIRLFGDIWRGVAQLLLPYFVWLLFATYLNIAIAILN